MNKASIQVSHSPRERLESMDCLFRYSSFKIIIYRLQM
jgi:hypothetical protein